MAYSPALSIRDAITLRRLAWASGIPMTRMLHEIIIASVNRVNHSMVCQYCKDKSKCNNCPFA